MAGFNNTLNAMMMNPSFQAMLNPFLLGGNGSAMFNQLLQAQSLANWGNMSSMPMKSMSQAWMMNNMNKVSVVFVNFSFSVCILSRFILLKG